MEIDEETLMEIYEGITGRGELNWLHVPGITTFPADDDLHHRACLELERRGLIRRERDEGKHIFWLANEDTSAAAPPSHGEG